jgi:ribosome-associated heat shock protein Hsp15
MLKSAFYASQAKRDKGTGRPTKKDRREIDNFSDDDLSDFFN